MNRKRPTPQDFVGRRYQMKRDPYSCFTVQGVSAGGKQLLVADMADQRPPGRQVTPLPFKLVRDCVRAGTLVEIGPVTDTLLDMVRGWETERRRRERRGQ